MIRIYNRYKQKTIRLYSAYNLIFFVYIFLGACTGEKSSEIGIIWNNKEARGISIPAGLLKGAPTDSIDQQLVIRLAKDYNAPPILGSYTRQNGSVIFEPLIPFSRGLQYEVLFRNERIDEFTIPPANPADAPKLINIYPTQDTLPENLLKIYLQFSQPMQEGVSGQYITLVKDDQDTLSGVFLNLQPELWNEDRTVLTVWLDPGRIKRDLLPNKRLGNPLKEGEWYRLSISNKWKDKQGLELKQPYGRKFYVGLRDGLSPDPEKWTLGVPREGTNRALEIGFGEPLDYFLADETISILDEKGNAVEGSAEIYNEEKNYRFIPLQSWTAGTYTLRVQTRLEDLAGNNINRVFDRDIRDKTSPGTGSIVERHFRIAPVNDTKD